MDEIQQYWRFGVALALGLIVGLQREQDLSRDSENPVGGSGVRTFAITSLLGAVLSWFGDAWESMVPVAMGFAVVGIMNILTYIARMNRGQLGITTDISLLMVFLLGALCWRGQIVLATALSMVLTMLLTFKIQLREFARSLTQADVLAVVKFLIITVVVLPLLPNENYGPEPFNIFNPHSIWLLMVFISAISFLGYILMKLVGVDKGIGITGFLGGLASSTALTLSFTQKSKETPLLSSSLSTGIIAAWLVMYARVLVVVWIISPEFGRAMALPVLLPIVPGLICYVWFWFRDRNLRLSASQVPEFTNPFELAPAFKFAAIYVVVLAVSQFARIQFGDHGLLISSFMAGMADVYAIALSVAQMSLFEGVDFHRSATLAVVVAGIANTWAKGSIAIFMGAPAMRRPIITAVVAFTLGGVASLFLI